MKLSVDITTRLKTSNGEFVLDASFETEDERIVLFGPSGAGKSLTVQAIAGLIQPQRGRIKLGNRVLLDTETKINLPARNRRIGYLFQDYALFPHLTVAENIAFPLKRLFHPLTEAEQHQVSEMLNRFELTSVAHSLPRQLSGGQRQRTALARALIVKPDLLLLDEPFAALDTLLRSRLRHELVAIQARFGIPMVVITHDLEDVRLFADTLVTYDIGRTRKPLNCKQLSHRLSDEMAWRIVQDACLPVAPEFALSTPSNFSNFIQESEI